MIGQKIKQLLAIVVASMSSMMVFMSLYNVYVTYQITVEESEGLTRIFHHKNRSFLESFIAKGFAPTKTKKRACHIVTKLHSSFRA